MDRGLREFAFISTCLLLGASFDRERGVAVHDRPASLGTVFRDTNMASSMALVDISDLDAIRYGVVAFRLIVMIHVSGNPDGSDDSDGEEVWGDGPGHRDVDLEEDRTRDPLSTAAWAQTVENSQPLAHGLSSTTDFKAVLRRHLQQQSPTIGHLRSTGQLLGLAFAHEPHLNLDPFANLSAVAIAAALETTPIPPTSISLTINMLLNPVNLYHRHPHRTPLPPSPLSPPKPTRSSNHASTTFFLTIASHLRNPPARLPHPHLSGAHSAPLRKKIFLPVRVTFLLSSNISNHQFFYVGDSLLPPYRFAAGFLLYLRSLLTSTHAPRFAGDSPTSLRKCEVIFTEVAWKMK
ncbi:hypothetical protein N657DRAFT_694281 [Parathielavia appendiculata]|uniref:Uncharacterized protein n=1 Tax=Parathielavia appendiculata TaxID=2587402 RepID=A0AAN6TQB9_9PEZI|nr:hypothetical protein N657DRAFT_694281 [Parathielavia appendiculata]